MAKRKKGDRKLPISRQKMERAEEDERKIIKNPTEGTKSGLLEPLITRREAFDDPIIAKPDPTKFDDPIIATDKLDSIKKPTDDDLK